MLRGSSARRAYARPNRSRNGRGPTPVQSTAGSFAGKNCRNRVFSGLLTSETEGDRLFLPGKAATLALSGGLGGISGDRRTRMGHTYPLPGSMAPQGALCPKLARFMGGHPLQAGKDRALNKRARDQPVLNGGLVGISGARRMHIDHTYPLPESMAPKGALCPQHARFPNAHPNGRPLVKRASLGHKAPWGAILPGSG